MALSRWHRLNGLAVITPAPAAPSSSVRVDDLLVGQRLTQMDKDCKAAVVDLQELPELITIWPQHRYQLAFQLGAVVRAIVGEGEFQAATFLRAS